MLLTSTLECIIFKTYYSHVSNHILRGFAPSLQGRVWVTQSRAGRPRKWGISDFGCLAFRVVIFGSSSTAGPIIFALDVFFVFAVFRAGPFVENCDKFHVLCKIWCRISYCVRFKQVWCKLWTIVWKSGSWLTIQTISPGPCYFELGRHFLRFFLLRGKSFCFCSSPGHLVLWSRGPLVPAPLNTGPLLAKVSWFVCLLCVCVIVINIIILINIIISTTLLLLLLIIIIIIIIINIIIRTTITIITTIIINIAIISIITTIIINIIIIIINIISLIHIIISTTLIIITITTISIININIVIITIIITNIDSS